ncbi:MAG: ABC transporter ATP-binding protein [Spirochaetales bacterium]|jgi:iron complex transport system ATP-binding protein|nr:ABC transporter ATP-binding protein [Spirochaetales bacterium]
MNPFLTTKDLTYSINDVDILNGIDFSIDEGEFVGIIGPNGAGKTTLLKQLLGLIVPTSGAVELTGKPLSDMDPKVRAKLEAYLSQDVMTTFSYPVLDIVLMGRYPYLGRFSRESAADIEIARRSLTYVGLRNFETRSFDQLSGGERQLVLFAKVLAQDAKLLILDEPTSNLDIRHQDQFFSMASELAKENKAVVAAVHNLDIAARYCSRLVLLDNGRIAASGPPKEVLKSSILDSVYGIRTTISTNTATGSLMVDVVPNRWEQNGPRIHIIGGAGSAINLTRDLARFGCRLTGGVSHQFDADEQLWNTLDIPFESVEPFSQISTDDAPKTREWVEEADLTILCEFPVGSGNLANLELAAKAKKLLIVEEAVELRQRSFFIDDGEMVFRRISDGVPSMSYEELISAFESGTIAELIK